MSKFANGHSKIKKHSRDHLSGCQFFDAVMVRRYAVRRSPIGGYSSYTLFGFFKYGVFCFGFFCD